MILYESYLILDTEGSPTGPRPVRSLVRNIYLLHQHLFKAFDGERSRFLFRVLYSHPVKVIVRSIVAPNWEEAFPEYRSGKCLHLAVPPKVEQISGLFKEGTSLRFSIRVNPTIKKQDDYHRSGYRVSLCYPKHALSYLKRNSFSFDADFEKAILAQDERASSEAVFLGCKHWLERKGAASGFTVTNCIVTDEGFRKLFRPSHRGRNHEDPLIFRSTMISGNLVVSNTDSFARVLSAGIGSGKAFGFGLLSVAEEK